MILRSNFFASIIAVFALAVVPSAAFAVACKTVPADAPVSPAEQAYRDGDGKRAMELYHSELAANPQDLRLVYGFVQAALSQGSDDEARSVLGQHIPATSAWILIAQSQYALRQGDFDRARQYAFAAVKADVCNAHAHLQAAEMLDFSAMYAQSKKQRLIARTLDQSAPATYWAWLRYQPADVRLKEMKRMADDTRTPAKWREFAAKAVGRLEARTAGGGHNCHLVSANASSKTTMTALMGDGANVRAWGLSVKVNDHATTVLLDTGASGFVLNHAAAEKSGLKMVERGKYGGIGDNGPVNISYAYADRIRIGDMEFSDCLVRVDDRRSVAGTQGLIGTDVFSEKLVTLDYPMREFRIAPLPGTAEQSNSINTDGSSGSDAETAEPTDAYDGPELKDYLNVYLASSKVILPLLLNSKPETMMMDTGSDGTLFDRSKAKEFTSVKLDSSYNGAIEGVSGKVKDVYLTGQVYIQMGPIAQYQNGAMAVNFNGPDEPQLAGLLGSSFLYNLVVDIDYRDARVRFTYDPLHGHNAVVHH